MTRLMVLGLLKKKPMSGYEMQQLLHQAHVEHWAGILPGSIYHALKKLEKEGFAAIEAVANTGNRAKAIYAITPQGEREYARLIEEALSAPLISFPTGLYTGLLFHGDISKEKKMQALDLQIRELETKFEQAKAGQALKRGSLPQESELVFENMFEIYRAHLKFLYKVKKLLSGDSPHRQDGDGGGERHDHLD